MSSSSSSSSSEAAVSDDDCERLQIRDDLSTMTFQELMQLKEELGSKVYKEAVFGVTDKRKRPNQNDECFKRLNKNRPREQSSRRQVPFLGSEQRTLKKQESELRDPRFDENSGTYDPKNFKENYKFLNNVRRKEIDQLKKQLTETTDEDERKNIKFSMQRLVNKNVEEKNWHEKQKMLKEEQQDIQKAISEGRTPHYTTKKERRAKELVKKFETLKQTGKLGKHLEKKRKKNTAKDRKKFSFD